MSRRDVAAWVERYEQVWRRGSPVAELFAPDATYLVSPWAEPLVGIDAIAELWPTGAGENEFAMTSDIVAVDGATSVVRVVVDYASGERWRDLWIVTLDAEGRCTAFEEWPFAPDQPDGQGR